MGSSCGSCAEFSSPLALDFVLSCQVCRVGEGDSWCQRPAQPLGEPEGCSCHPCSWSDKIRQAGCRLKCLPVSFFNRSARVGGCTVLGYHHGFVITVDVEVFYIQKGSYGGNMLVDLGKWSSAAFCPQQLRSLKYWFYAIQTCSYVQRRTKQTKPT